VNFDLSIFVQALTSPANLDGVRVTIALTVVAMVFGVGLGLLVALLREQHSVVLRALGTGYVWIFRAVPTLVQLFFVWNALPQLFPILRGDWFSSFLAATIALSMNEAAYAAEILRGGLLAIDEGQWLAARALGLTPPQVFVKVIAPQLTRVVIPPLANDFITMLKITSLASVISLQELLARTQTAIASTFRFAEYYAAAAVYYLVLVSVFMVVQGQLERRFAWTSAERRETSAMARLRRLAALR
jgi:His/Glu/Gln/Arg/opine family amino acid ABC transporter permease subunit